MKKNPETKGHKLAPSPKNAKQLAQAIFSVADKKLPADKRRLTKSLLKSGKTAD